MLQRCTRSLPLLSLALLLPACAGSSPRAVTPDPPQTIQMQTGTSSMSIARHGSDIRGTATFSQDIRRVWAGLPAVYDSLGVPVSRVDPVAFVIGSDGFRARRRLGRVPLARYLDCGQSQGGPSAETYDLQISVITSLDRGQPGQTVATTVVRATGKPVSFSGSPVECLSTGALEAMIHDLLRRSL